MMALKNLFDAPGLRSSWDELCASMQELDLGQTYAWNCCWWEFYSPNSSFKKDLLILQAQDNSSIWPLFLRRRLGLRILHWIGQVDGMITDYAGPLIRPGAEEKECRSFCEYLSAHISDWDFLELTVPNWSPAAIPLLEALTRHGPHLGLKCTVTLSDLSVVLRLPSSFEEYLQALGRSTRADLRKYLRVIGQKGGAIEIVKGEKALPHLAELFELNAQNWMVFADQRSRGFFSKMVSSLRQDKGQVFLALLRMQGRTLAAVLGFQFADLCFLHPAGVSRLKVDGLSPGLALYAGLVQQLLAEGFTRVDFSPGLEEYKFRLGGALEPTYRVVVSHRKSQTVRWRLYELGRSLRRNSVSVNGRTLER